VSQYWPLVQLTTLLFKATIRDMITRTRSFAKRTSSKSRGTRWFGLVCSSIVLCCWPAHAQGTFTAASCNYSDVNAVIKGPTHVAVNGDTIIIPAGTCTWTSGISISGLGIDIAGSGTPNTSGGTMGAGKSTTTLVDAASAPLFSFTGIPFGQTAKVELMNLSAGGAGARSIIAAVTFAGTCTASGCPDIRADNITFTSGTWGAASDSGAVILADNVFGVIDHNTGSEPSCSSCFMTDVSFHSWQGVGGSGDNSFASADTFGTAQTLFIENNNENNIRLTENDVAPPGGAVGGGRWVCRFNTITNMSGNGICGAHGTAWGGRFRGMRQVEAYYNTITATVCNTINGILSGTGYYLSNTLTGTGCNAVNGVDIARFVKSGAPWNNCDGTQPWDQNPFSSSSACLDQPGSAAGALLQNGTPVLAIAPGTPCTILGQCWPNPAISPIYEAGEVTPNNAPGISVATDGSSTRVLANRDYYAQVSDVAQTSATSPFNGTSGTGYGTLANRPTSCTHHVGYWATDQGTWNTYNSSQEGVLYVCTSEGTWASQYTPYTYPHPLVTGGTASNPPPNPPTNLTATVQ
jgi:hypothetical protein